VRRCWRGIICKELTIRQNHETQVTVEFQAKGEGTDLVLTHERFRDESLKSDHAQGWQGCLERLSQKVGVAR
jgi:Activator of Hsp90 ATPase homolog 1-like protein